MPFNGRKHYAIKQRFDSEFNWLTEQPGIYRFGRGNEEKQKFCVYVGQAKNLKNRRFDYYKIECGLSYPTRHFEASLKKHKDGEFEVLENCHQDMLNEREQHGIKYYMQQPNVESYNKEAETDIVRSNYKRIHTVYTRYENNIKKMLKHLEIGITPLSMVVNVKMNKNNTPNKQSEKAFYELTNGLKGLMENGKDN